MAHKSRCKRCGSYTPSGYESCAPRVEYHDRPRSTLERVAVAGGAVYVLQVALRLTLVVVEVVRRWYVGG